MPNNETTEAGNGMAKVLLVDDGPTRVVFLRSGPGFRRVEVELLHRDHRAAVLPADTGIFPGNPVVTRGAFALELALDRAGGGDGGHGHAH